MLVCPAAALFGGAQTSSSGTFGAMARPSLYLLLAPSLLVACGGAPPPVAPPSSVGLLDLVPREPFGLPVMGWIGIALFVGMLVLTLASML